MSRESVRISFLPESLNDLEVFACSIGNVYLNTKCMDKFWTESGTDFDNEKVMVIIIERALYGFKSSGATCLKN